MVARAIISAGKRQRQEDDEVEVSLDYTVSLRAV